MHHSLGFGSLPREQVNRKSLKTNAWEIVKHVDVSVFVKLVSKYRLQL